MNLLLQNAIQHWDMVSPVIDTPKNSDDYLQLIKNIQDAIQLAETSNNSSLDSLIEIMAAAAQKYESNLVVHFNNGALPALKYLIKVQGIRQSDLPEIGSQGVVSEVLNGKRSLTLRHVRELSKRFNVSPNVFINN